MHLYLFRMQQLTFLIIGVNLKRTNTSIFRFTARVDAFLFVYQKPLMPFEGESLVEPASFATVQF